MTPTIDHTEASSRGECLCADGSFCPPCMAKLQKERQRWALERWLQEWDRVSPPAPRGRPLLRVIDGGRA